MKNGYVLPHVCLVMLGLSYIHLSMSQASPSLASFLAVADHQAVDRNNAPPAVISTNTILTFENPTSWTAWKRFSIQTIRWYATEAMTNGVELAASVDDGTTWDVVEESIPCTEGTNYYAWTIETAYPTPDARLRLLVNTHPPTVAISDAFVIAGYEIISPNSTNVWRPSETRLIEWVEAGGGNAVNVYYSIAPPGNTWTSIAINSPTVEFPLTNTMQWSPPDLPGPARIRIQSSISAELYNDSDTFIVGDISITQPEMGSRHFTGSRCKVTWEQAGFEPETGALIHLSSDGGLTFQHTPIHTADLLLAANCWEWEIPNGTPPDTYSILRLSVTNSAASFGVLSEPFTIEALPTLLVIR